MYSDRGWSRTGILLHTVEVGREKHDRCTKKELFEVSMVPFIVFAEQPTFPVASKSKKKKLAKELSTVLMLTAKFLEMLSA